jgi:hypothetical protein
MASRRRVKLTRKLRRAFRDYLRYGDEAADAVAVINRAKAARQRREVSHGPG